ncbi:OmpH family outer membrane protein [Thioalkalivibrio sp. XN8]|uniref:OmpH family outer membrane protein n=1 Tax=Thioalkalivibrio sp. XN8 TaxID=2712863 RepID=UPI0013EB5343|nr:OmpH family outer membrane protein [Thioalkalivibrio sp. XN8]NGP53618.1 OmpH family outer membrane protein [Thioalkalivibrio sp. XN8]
MKASHRTLVRNLAATLLVVLLAAPTTALAETRIGVVKLNRLFEEAPQALALQRSLTEEFAPRERELRSKQEELVALQERLQQSDGFMSEDERRRVEQQFRDGQRDFQRTQNEFMEDLNLRRNERLGELQRLFIAEIQGYASSQGYDLVLVEGFIHASDALDITQQVLQVLQRRHQGG